MYHFYSVHTVHALLLYYYSFCFLWQPSRREICTGRWIFHHMTEKHQEMKSISGKSKQRMWTTRIACDLRVKGVPAVSACMQTCTVWLSNCLRASYLPLQYPRCRHLCVCVWERAREPVVCSWSPALSDRRITVATPWPVWALNILTRVCLWGGFCQCCLKSFTQSQAYTHTHKTFQVEPTNTHTHLPDRPRQTCKPQILTYVLFPSGFTCPTHSSHCLSFPLSTRARSDGHLVLCLKMWWAPDTRHLSPTHLKASVSTSGWASLHVSVQDCKWVILNEHVRRVGKCW